MAQQSQAPLHKGFILQPLIWLRRSWSLILLSPSCPLASIKAGSVEMPVTFFNFYAVHCYFTPC